MTNTISFPRLNLGPFSIPESFSLFGLNIHLYGLIIGVGILVAYIFALKTCKKHNLTQENITDILLYGLPSAIVCARLYYVLFKLDEFKNFWDVFKIWNGGIAIYGAIIGAVISTYIYCRAKKINVLSAFDIGAFGLLIGQIFGRWGNFVNAEAFGRPTNLPWGMLLHDLSQNMMFHPTFLYESLWNIGVFVILLLRRDKRKFDGELFFLYITLYGAGRFWIEGLRTDSLYLGPLRISQLVALLCIAVGIAVIVYKRNKVKKTTD